MLYTRASPGPPAAFGDPVDGHLLRPCFGRAVSHTVVLENRGIGVGLSTPFVLVTVCCWLAFGVVWGVGWLHNLRRAPATARRSSNLPQWIGGAAILLALTHAGRWQPLLSAAHTPMWSQVAGAAALVASTALALWARVVLGTMWSGGPEVKTAHLLRTGGPYAITRHPIYTGVVGMLLGTALVGGSWDWALVAVLGTVIVLFKVPAEERLMMETFGEGYRAYQRRVPALIPGLRHARGGRR